MTGNVYELEGATLSLHKVAKLHQKYYRDGGTTIPRATTFRGRTAYKEIKVYVSVYLERSFLDNLLSTAVEVAGSRRRVVHMIWDPASNRSSSSWRFNSLKSGKSGIPVENLMALLDMAGHCLSEAEPCVIKYRVRSDFVRGQLIRHCMRDPSDQT